MWQHRLTSLLIYSWSLARGTQGLSPLHSWMHSTHPRPDDIHLQAHNWVSFFVCKSKSVCIVSSNLLFISLDTILQIVSAYFVCSLTSYFFLISHTVSSIKILTQATEVALVYLSFFILSIRNFGSYSKNKHHLILGFNEQARFRKRSFIPIKGN